MRMTMAEALVAATLNSAAALGVSDRYGSLTEGKYADMVIINADRYVLYYSSNFLLTHKKFNVLKPLCFILQTGRASIYIKTTFL